MTDTITEAQALIGAIRTYVAAPRGFQESGIPGLLSLLDNWEVSHLPLHGEDAGDPREDFAHWLDGLHGDYVTEGGCDFAPWRRGWRPGARGRVDDSIVDPIIERVGAMIEARA